MLAIIIAFFAGAFAGLVIHALLVAVGQKTPAPTPRTHALDAHVRALHPHVRENLLPF
jgi:hypothetical protein